MGDATKSDSPHTRERLLDIAEEIIGREGIEGMRLRDLAEPLGIRVPSIYAHFKGREDVITSVVKRYIEALGQQFPDDGSEDPMVSLDRGVRKYTQLMLTHPAFVRLKLRDQEMVGGMPEMDFVSQGTMAENLETGPSSKMYQRVQAILDRGFKSGVFREMRIEVFWREMIGLVFMSLTFPATRSLLDSKASPEEIAATVNEIAECCRRLVIHL